MAAITTTISTKSDAAVLTDLQSYVFPSGNSITAFSSNALNPGLPPYVMTWTQTPTDDDKHIVANYFMGRGNFQQV